MTLSPARRAISGLALLALLAFGGALAHAAAQDAARPAGRIGVASAVIPDNRLVAPAGTTLATGVWPLAALRLPNGHLLLSEDGAGQNTLENVDLAAGRVVQTLPVRGELFMGLAFDPRTGTVYAAGGGSHTIFRYAVDAAGLLLPRDPLTTPDGFWGALAYLPGSKRLLAADNLGARLVSFDAAGLQRAASTGDHPVALAVSPDERLAYLASAGTNEITVLRLDGGGPSPSASIPVGRYPTALVLSRDGRTLYVANANDDSISVLDTAAGRVRATFPLRAAGTPPGTAPDALALSPDERTLYVADGGENAVAVLDAATGLVRGRIPTGWWPSALAIAPDGRTLYVASIKGLGFGPNPGFKPFGGGSPDQYIASGLRGALSLIPVPDAPTLARYTARVAAQARVAELAPAPLAGNPIPAALGGRTPFRHVIVLVKENRSYDQVFGDLKGGNGDAALTIFGRQVTPNLHALAERYGLLDNVYANGEVSADGHQWIDGAYASTYLQQTWPEHYGSVGARPIDFGIAPISFPPSGYIFNNAAAHQVSFRTYGEQFNAGPFQLLYLGHADLSYPAFLLNLTDQQRADEWLREFRGFARDGNLPQLEYVWLPRDHTTGTTPTQNTPFAQVADNDLAVGRIVEAVSRSRYWKDTLILSTEDDAQNGPDHVDGHRTEALAISAYNKRGAVIHTHYDQLSIVRTVELILNLPPLSQFDARALPMYDVFRTDGTPDPAPFAALPARVSLAARNAADAPLASASARLDFSGPDRADTGTLNRILWAAAHGTSRPYPALGAPHTVPHGREE